MKKDRFLLAILVFILLLVAVAIAAYFLRQGEAGYQPDTTPENIARNYVLALQNKDFEKAYSYLKKQDNTPSLSEFRETFYKQQNTISDTGLQIADVIEQDEHATLEIIILHGGGAPFGSTWRESNSAQLEKIDSDWKIVYFPAPYWGWDWQTPSSRY